MADPTYTIFHDEALACYGVTAADGSDVFPELRTSGTYDAARLRAERWAMEHPCAVVLDENAATRTVYRDGRVASRQAWVEENEYA